MFAPLLDIGGWGVKLLWSDDQIKSNKVPHLSEMIKTVFVKTQSPMAETNFTSSNHSQSLMVENSNHFPFHYFLPHPPPKAASISRKNRGEIYVRKLCLSLVVFGRDWAKEEEKTQKNKIRCASSSKRLFFLYLF